MSPNCRLALRGRQIYQAAVLCLVFTTSCVGSGFESSSSEPSKSEDDNSETNTTTNTTTDTTADATADTTVLAAPATPELTLPAWLGQRPLVTDDQGFGVAEPTPTELVDRKLPTTDTLPPPPADEFISTISALDGEPLERSTWKEGCPVDPIGLRYVTVSFWGFDGRPHTGELILAEEWAEDLVGVFEVAWNERFPFEEMRIVTLADLDAEPTGDGNNTASFVCRAVTGGSRFSEHAYGLAIDINPFHNPYLRGQLLLPELAGAYLEREDSRDGMLYANSSVVLAFAEIGWSWGGEWSSLKDWQHFSHNGL